MNLCYACTDVCNAKPHIGAETKEKDGTYDCIIKRDLYSPNIIFFDGEVSDDLQYFPTKIIQQNNGGNKA